MGAARRTKDHQPERFLRSEQPIVQLHMVTHHYALVDRTQRLDLDAETRDQQQMIGGDQSSIKDEAVVIFVLHDQVSSTPLDKQRQHRNNNLAVYRQTQPLAGEQTAEP